MNIQTAIEEARKTKMVIKKKWWPEGYSISEDAGWLIGSRQGLIYRFDIESLLSEDWIVTAENLQEEKK